MNETKERFYFYDSITLRAEYTYRHTYERNEYGKPIYKSSSLKMIKDFYFSGTLDVIKFFENGSQEGEDIYFEYKNED